MPLPDNIRDAFSAPYCCSFLTEVQETPVEHTSCDFLKVGFTDLRGDHPTLTFLFIYLVWVPECAYHGICIEVKWQLVEVSSLFPPVGLGLNLDHQANMKCINVISNAWCWEFGKLLK